MTDQRYRFCPRCGTALVAGMPFCPNCGLNTAEAPKPGEAETAEEPDAFGTVDWGKGVDTRPSVTIRPETPAPIPPSELRSRPASAGTPLIIAAALVAVGLIGYALLTRPPPAREPTASPQVGPSGVVVSFQPGSSIAAPSAPIMTLTIQSPTDGQTVATSEVTVIGLAPPGLKVTRDISFGLDQHATADGTGHWAINVRLNEGQNELVFRIGDDRSTEKRIRVTYTPPP